MWLPRFMRKKKKVDKREYLSPDYKKYLAEEQWSRKLNFYERLCKFFGRFMKTSLGESFKEKQAKNIRVARLIITPEEIGGTLILSTSIVFIIFLILTFLLFSPLNILIWLLPVFWIYYILSYTSFRAEVTRIQSSDAALRVVLYMAMFLDMNPSLEGAIRTAARHTSGPLGKDLSKLLWDVEVGKYTSIKSALGIYMKLWREWSHDFVKALEYLINSISRPGKDRRMMIKKSQQYIIEATYNNMQQYSRNLKGPINLVHMMGIVLPIMGLIMFPLISIFIQDSINPWYIVVGYLVVLPSFLFFVIHRQIAKRPGAYSHPTIEDVPNLPPRNVLPINLSQSTIYLPLLPIALIVSLLFITPGILHFFNLLTAYVQGSVDPVSFKIFMKNLYQGPVLIRNMLESFTLFWGVIAGLVTYFVGRSYKRKKIREIIEEIEHDVDLALTELENSLSRNIPIERSLFEVIEEYQKIGEEQSPLHHFFVGVLRRIQQLGMTFHDAVFSRNGAIHSYPSALLKNIMRIVSNSVYKGTNVLVANIRTINEYVQNNNRIEKLIKSLLDETLGSMKMLAMFIAPLMSSMAASIGTMILEILKKISESLADIERQFGISTGLNELGGEGGPLAQLTQFEKVMPPTLTMIIVGFYLIETTIILSYFITGVEHGFDEINRDMLLGKYLMYAGIIFTLLVLGSVIMFLPFIEGIGAKI